MHLKNLVYNYKTAHKEGFTKREIEELISRFPRLNKEKFNKAFYGNTCMIKNGEIITYHIDVLTALRCGLENRDVNSLEFD